MGGFIDYLSSSAPSTIILAVLLVACGWYLYSHGLPAIQNQKTFEEERAKWQKEKDELNAVIKNHVTQDSTEQLLLDLIKTCQATHEMVSSLVVETDKEFVELADKLDKLIGTLKEVSASSDSTLLRRVEGLDAELRLITQQVSAVSYRLATITGLLIGNQQRSALSDLMGNDVKDLK